MHIEQPSRRRVLFQAVVVAMCAVALAAWRLTSGLAMIGDSGSYLAGAAGLSDGRFFETPLVPSFSELPLLDTVRNGGWSPYADFGIGLPIVIALFGLALPLTTAAGVVNVLSIGLIALGVVIGPWSPRRNGELWFRSVLAIALSCWPILRFTATGVLSEPFFCALLIWVAILIARWDVSRMRSLAVLGILTTAIGTVRFVGPVVAIVVGILLFQRGVSRARAAAWTTIAALAPLIITAVAAGRNGTRILGVHALDRTDVFFTARGVGGWFEAGLGDQTRTLLRTSFQPNVFDWIITVGAIAATVVVLSMWITSLRRRTASHLEPPFVLAVTLALAVLPSMVFIDAVVKLENRILMPSGLLVICGVGWWLARRSRIPWSWTVLVLWAVSATHPWQWLDHPGSPEPTPLTDAVESLDASYVLTDQADLVWWITHQPARYLPDGYHDLSDRRYDAQSIMARLACELDRTNGAIVIHAGLVSRDVDTQLVLDTVAGRYTKRTHPDGIISYRPTGFGC